MNRTPRTLPRPHHWPAVLLAGLLASGAGSFAASPLAEAQARYKAERAACLEGRTHQDRTTCLREAGAAYAEARRGTLDKGLQAQYLANAMQRCKPLPDDERKDCEARVRGEGKVSGSVEGGGIYRETVTVIVGEPGASAPSR